MITIEFLDIAPLKIEAQTNLWLEKIILHEDKKIGNIHYILTHDEKVLEVNRDFLQHDYYTDIITFDYVKGKTISGDIYVSIDRVKDNATILSKDFKAELHRVLAHGILHLCGYKDKTDSETQQMRAKEDFYLSLIQNLFV